MSLLALNTVLPQSMRTKFQFAIGILPIGLMLASIFPLFLLAAWFEASFGIPANSPIKQHPNGGMWIAAFMSTFVVLMVLGYVIGWIANAAIARYILGWSTEKVRAVYLRSDVPVHWLKDGTTASGNADAQSMASWEAQRKLGALRFIAVRGVLAWGGPMLLTMHVVPTFLNGRGFTPAGTLFSIALWACAGASFGAIIWFCSESTYHKLKQRSEV